LASVRNLVCEFPRLSVYRVRWVKALVWAVMDGASSRQMPPDAPDT